jgi:DNA end-binding protein Ku
MARALWKGSIAFGLVNIPVELHTAVRDSRPRFRMLHARDKSPVRFERVCAREGKPVAWEELVKGYEYEKGRFIVLTKGGERAYALLREAIKETGLVGIATIVLRDAQHLAALEVAGDAMVLTLMRYAEELVDTREYHFPPAKDVRKPELQMARTLVENLADKWDPSQYTDEYRENLMKIIKAKLKGKEPHLVEHVEPQNAEVVDLMERLRQSLQGAGSAAGVKKKAARAQKTSARTRKRPHAA